MSMEHTPTPWRTGRPGTVVADHPVPEIAGSDMVECYGGHLIAESVAERNVRRIVACVNACEGISTPELELMTGELSIHSQITHKPKCEAPATYRAVEYRRQRDQLAEALRGIAGHHEAQDMINIARTALAGMEDA